MKQKGVVPVVILVTIAVLLGTAAGTLIWQRRAILDNLPTSTPTQFQTPQPISTSPSFQTQIQSIPTTLPQPKSPTGEIAITTDRSSYQVNETILVTISNNTQNTFYAQDGNAYCTILTIERNVDGNWTITGRCIAAQPPGSVAIEPGKITKTFKFSNFTGSPQTLPAGTYRFRLDYSTSKLPTSGGVSPFRTTYSQEFQIR